MISQVELFFNIPLYHKVDIVLGNALFNLLGHGKFDFYSPTLKENTTYEITSGRTDQGGDRSTFRSINLSSFIEVKLRCVRTGEQFLFYFFLDASNLILQKVGQFPSIADLHISKIKEFDKVLSKEKLREFTRAIGLAANGVGIGSFVYLRRIFEDLIEEAHIKESSANGWDENVYLQSRMSEKIALLKNHLPQFLVENKELYSVLSVGIHSLTEKDCLAYFETVKVGIELILEEKVERMEKDKRIEEAKSKIANLKSRLG